MKMKEKEWRKEIKTFVNLENETEPQIIFISVITNL